MRCKYAWADCPNYYRGECLAETDQPSCGVYASHEGGLLGEVANTVQALVGEMADISYLGHQSVGTLLGSANYRHLKIKPSGHDVAMELQLTEEEIARDAEMLGLDRAISYHAFRYIAKLAAAMKALLKRIAPDAPNVRREYNFWCQVIQLFRDAKEGRL